MGKVKGSNLKIIYKGRLEEINAETMLVSLLNMTEALNTINDYLNELHDSHNILKTKIEAFSKGSLIVDFNLYLEQIDDSTKKKKSHGVNDLIYSFVGMVVLKRFLGLRKPVSIKNINSAEIIIENDRGNTTIINHETFKLYYSSNALHEKVTNFFRALEADYLIDSIEFKLNNMKFIEVNKNYFSTLSEKIDTQYLEDTEDVFVHKK